MKLSNAEANTTGSSVSSLSVGQTLAYLAPSVPMSILAAPALATLPALYAKHGAVSMTMVGTILFATRIFDAVTDPMIGYLSDRFRTRIGNRKPWIIAGGLLSAIGAFYWLRPDADTGAMWFLICSVLVYLGWTFFEIPYSAWFSEVTPDYDDRSRLATYRSIANYAGYLIFVSAPLWPMFETTEMTPEVTALFSWVLLGALPITVAVAVWWAPEHVGPPRQIKAINPLTALKEVGGNPLFWMLTMPQALKSSASGMVGALYFFYLDNHLGILDKIAHIGITVAVLGVITAPIWAVVLERIGKHRVLALCTVATSFTLLGMGLLQPGPYALPLMIVLFGFSTIFSNGSNIAPMAMMADVIDYDEYKTGSAKAANYYAFPALFEKMGLAAGGGLAFIIAGLFGFTPDGTNDSLAMVGFFTAFIGIPIVLNLIAAAIIIRFPLTKSKHAAIKTRLVRRRFAQGQA
ncbi:MAG: MFS transporter [Gammaproteobacteria bacterium]|nr:MFS transporter [Gammaproteobacteria bacterium]MBT7879778.1 MFS transporter [Gammaproteobacteria bacterium]